MWRVAGALLFAVPMFFALPAQAALNADKTSVLADFNGVWLLDFAKSESLVKEAANRLSGLAGFKFSVDAKAMTIRMEWTDDQTRVYRITSVRAESGRLACALEGQQAEMILEKAPDGELLVWDRGEALAFINADREKTSP